MKSPGEDRWCRMLRLTMTDPRRRPEIMMNVCPSWMMSQAAVDKNQTTWRRISVRSDEVGRVENGP